MFKMFENEIIDLKHNISLKKNLNVYLNKNEKIFEQLMVKIK